MPGNYFVEVEVNNKKESFIVETVSQGFSLAELYTKKIQDRRDKINADIF